MFLKFYPPVFLTWVPTHGSISTFLLFITTSKEALAGSEFRKTNCSFPSVPCVSVTCSIVSWEGGGIGLFVCCGYRVSVASFQLLPFPFIDTSCLRLCGVFIGECPIRSFHTVWVASVLNNDLWCMKTLWEVHKWIASELSFYLQAFELLTSKPTRACYLKCRITPYHSILDYCMDTHKKIIFLLIPWD